MIAEETSPIDFNSESEQFTQITKLAFRSQYLLHIMLAISALHLYDQDNGRRDLLTRASYLSSTALTLAKPFYNALSEEESIGMLFFSGFISTYSLAEGSLTPLQSPESIVERLLQSFHLVRGITLLLAPHWQYLANSWAGPILKTNIEAGTASPISQTPPGMSGSPNEHYRAVRALAHGLDNSEQRQACLKAHEDVFKYMHILRGANDRTTSNRLIMTWANDVQPPFEELVRQNKPVALVILAEYAVLIRYGADLWWVRKWPDLLMEYIGRQLGEDFDEFLAWPRDQIQSGLHKSI